MIKILICDDQDLVCEGLRAILKTAPGMKVVGVAHDGAEALDLIPKVRPNLVLMDLKMPVMNGIQATQRIHREHTEVKVLVLTTYADDQWVFDAIRGGASGYLLKDTPREGLLKAIADTAAGKTPVDPAVAGQLFTHIAQGEPGPGAELLADLSAREVDVLRLLARGLSNAEIAARLHLSEGTVRNYVSSIFAKLNVSDRTNAAVLAIRCGIDRESSP